MGKELKKAIFSKGGKGGGYTIRLPIPKEMAEKIGITKKTHKLPLSLKKQNSY